MGITLNNNNKRKKSRLNRLKTQKKGLRHETDQEQSVKFCKTHTFGVSRAFTQGATIKLVCLYKEGEEALEKKKLVFRNENPAAPHSRQVSHFRLHKPNTLTVITQE